MPKMIFIWMFSLAILLGQSGAMAEECALAAGYEEEPPFHFSDENGFVRGLDADMLRAAAAAIDCSVEFLEIPWNRTLHEVAEGRIDIAMGARYLAERAEFAHYSAPYKTQRHSLIGFAPDVLPASALESHFSSSRSVVIVRGWHYPDSIRREIEKPENQELISIAPYFETALRMMLAGRADATIGNATTTKVLLTDMDVPADKTLHAVEVGDEPLSFLLSRQSVAHERALEFDAALKAYLSSASYRQLFANYDIDPSMMVAP